MKKLLTTILVALAVCFFGADGVANAKQNDVFRFFDSGQYLDREAMDHFYTEFYKLAKSNQYGVPTDFYTGGFLDGFIPEIHDKQHTNVLLLGGIRNVDTERLKDFDYIFVSQADLSAYLANQNIKNYYLPQFIEAKSPLLSQCVQDISATDCYFLVIGNQSPIVATLMANHIPFKHIEKFAPHITQEIKSDLAHISGIILNETLHLEDSNDINPALFYAIDYGIPVLTAGPIAFDGQFDTDPLFRLATLFADTLSYYSYNSDIDFFLRYPEARLKKAKSAQKILSYLYSTKTAAHKVFQIITKNEKFVVPLSDTLNIMLTIFPGIYNNGDYWIASDLADGLKNEYDDVLISFPSSLTAELGDVFIYLRGGRVLHENLVNKDNVSLLYLFYPLTVGKQDISDIKDFVQEFKNVDAVVTASDMIAEVVKNYGFDAYYIPQFTNVKKFYPDYTEELQSEVLFVGNNSPYRTAVPILLKGDVPLSVYGDAWPEGVAKARFIDNRILRKYYSSAKITLNDTRTDMRKLGFISNRIFDATACETLVISDYMPEIEDVYGDSVPMWKTEDELIELVKYYLDPAHEAERLDKAKRAREITLQNFTSDIAASKFMKIINEVKKRKGLQ